MKMIKVLIAIILLVSTKCYSQEFEGGFIKVRGSGGMPPYTFSLDGGAYQLKDTFFNVGVGQHRVDTKDLNNCVKTSNCTMYDKISMKLFVWNGTNYAEYIPSSSNTFSSIKLQASGGKPPYYFSRNSTTKYTLNKIYWNGLQRNTQYTFRVKDSLGYIYYINVTL